VNVAGQISEKNWNEKKIKMEVLMSRRLKRNL
jgi:hypothetical protein